MMVRKNHGKPEWGFRRLVVLPVVAWACVEVHRLVDAPDTHVNETLGYGLLVLIAAMSLGYSGLATVQDVFAIWRTGSGRPYAEPPNDPNGGSR